LQVDILEALDPDAARKTGHDVVRELAAHKR
jgi:hypothetical protein